MYNSRLIQRFNDICGEYGHRPAFVEDGKVVTYKELRETVNNLAKGFLSYGIKKGDHVGVWLPNYQEWIYTELALASIGAVIVPVNARFRRNEVEYVLRRADVSTLLMTSRFLTNDYESMVRELVIQRDVGDEESILVPDLPFLKKIITVRSPRLPKAFSYEAILDRGRGLPDSVVENARQEIYPDDPLFIFWTSGTTGFPKGVVHVHSVINNILDFSEFIGLSCEDRVIANKPWFYIAGNFWTMLMPLLNGAMIVPTTMFRPDEILDAIQQWSVNVLMATPQQMKALLDLYETDGRWSIDTLQTCVLGGAVLSPSLTRRMRACWGIGNITQIYGMTETQGYSMATPKGLDPDRVAEYVGYPLPGFECKVVGENGRTLNPGEVGELWVRGKLLQSYYKVDRAQTFDEEGWFRTGDLFTQDETGMYKVVGRIKDVIKVGGENVSSEEVERILMTHPNVRQVAVFGVPDAVRGEVCAAFVELKNGALDEELTEWCRSRMAPFKVPRYFHYVQSSQWPMTESSKIRKVDLKQRLLDELNAHQAAGDERWG